MKKWIIALLSILVIALLSACGNETKEGTANSTSTSAQTAGQTENSTQSTEGTSQPQDNATSKTGTALQLFENQKTGQYLADAQGKTLYYFTKDKPNTSNCKGDCLKKWPAFYAENPDVPEGFNKEDFGVITREDTSQKQTTYKGYPLYYFANDKAQGDVNGQGVKNVWYIVNQKTQFK